ncbi:MAG TPA: succinyl-CoA--3-ketoacid-CoA transferase, partial [Dehalococcoidia bacterium]|nr:succinyl-CoA--3-ketoacid-CoA transferase [Dehalococcoidia bacterium]
RGVGNVGGAMDLAAGARRIIVAMDHTDRDGNAKIVRECSFPLTGVTCVDTIVTDIAVIEVTADGLVLTEAAPGWNPAEVQAQTEPKLIVSPDFGEMQL